jgi:hypothetical protein
MKPHAPDPHLSATVASTGQSIPWSEALRAVFLGNAAPEDFILSFGEEHYLIEPKDPSGLRRPKTVSLNTSFGTNGEWPNE